jgi:hypothetical protein
MGELALPGEIVRHVTLPEIVWAQPSPRPPILWWGMISTVSRKYPLDPHLELHGCPPQK